MTQEEVLQYNKMCAEFLNWESLSPKTKYCYWKFPQELCFTLRAGEPVHSNNLLFHSDWNQIMEVVEAIAVYYKDKEIPQIHLLNQPIFSSKEAVVQAINQFLIWYNENKVN